MKRWYCILLLAMLLPVHSIAADKASNDSVTIKTEQNGVFKGLLYKVWGKLRALSPSAPSRNHNRATATAGIRGAETTESLLDPYWMGDKTNDPDYVKELTTYASAQQLAEKGDLPAAVKALSAFIEQYDKSDLKPNAQFALGLSYGGMGQNDPGIKALQEFVDDNPKHPLVADAKQVIQELK